MDQKRFHFIEVSDAGEPESPGISVHAPHLGPPVEEIPPRQFLGFHDLISLQPKAQILKKLSKNLTEKYRALPLALQPVQLPLRLPKHLEPRFHALWEAQGALILYLGMCDVSNGHTLRLLHNATGYTLYGIPLLGAAFEQFMREQYSLRLEG